MCSPAPSVRVGDQRHPRLAICLAHRSQASDVQAHGLENERPQSGLRYLLTFKEIDGADAAAVQARVEELLRVLHLGTLRERQPYGVLEHFADAYDAVKRPHRHSLWPGGLLPLHFLDYGWASAQNYPA